MTPVDLVVPTIGRPSLGRLLASLAAGDGPFPGRIILADDRAAPDGPLEVSAAGPLAARIEVVATGGRGPAAARNAGWRRAGAAWVAFLDDDVVPAPGWAADLVADIAAAAPDVAGSTGRVVVPLPDGRRPTDRERGVAGLMDSWWITADAAYRREALEAVAGFDERFPRAYREDADLALRLRAAGWRLVAGGRTVDHPVGEAGWSASVRAQRGNADDMLMRALHGPRWRERARAGRGRKGRHALVTALGAAAAALAAAGRPRPALVPAALWAIATGRFAWRRIAPGPRTPGEVTAMVATSVLIPPAATWHTARGWLRARRLTAAGGASEPAAVGRAAGADLRRVVPAEPAAELPVGVAVPRLGEGR